MPSISMRSIGSRTAYTLALYPGFPLMSGQGRGLGASVRCFKQCQLNKGAGAAKTAPARLVADMSLVMHVGVRMSESQRKIIEREAKSLNMTISSYMRAVALLCSGTPIESDPFDGVAVQEAFEGVGSSDE